MVGQPKIKQQIIDYIQPCRSLPHPGDSWLSHQGHGFLTGVLSMALRGQPYLPLYVDDFLTDEKLIECSAKSHGVYIRLMCIMHKSEEYGTILLRQKDQQTDQQINNFAIKLSRSMPFSIETILESLEELIEERVLTIDNDKLLQKRMIRDNSISTKRSEAGSKGGFATAKSTANITANTVIENVIENESNSSSEEDYKEEQKTFDQFWAAYPKKKSKGDAQKAWSKIKSPVETLTKILTALEWQKKSKDWVKEQGQYIPLPASYIRSLRWEDEKDAKEESVADYLSNIFKGESKIVRD